MRPPDTSHTDKYQKDNQFLHPQWCTVAEDCWCSVAEDNWRTVGEDHWCIMPEDRWCIVARGVTDSFLGLVRQVLDMQYLPDYKDLVARQFETYVTQHNYNADQIRFLRAVQSVFLQKRHLETADLYDAPAIVGFGQDAVNVGLQRRKWKKWLSL